MSDTKDKEEGGLTDASIDSMVQMVESAELFAATMGGMKTSVALRIMLKAAQVMNRPKTDPNAKTFMEMATSKREH